MLTKKISEVKNLPKDFEVRNYPSVFYGQGMDFHGIQNFSGGRLKALLAPFFENNPKNIQRGYIVIAGADGYRGAFSFSELCNRNDQADVLIINQGTKSRKGRFRLFPAADFFSDRAIYAVSEIHFLSL